MSHEFIFSFAFAAMLITLKATPFELGDEKMKEVILDAVNGFQQNRLCRSPCS